MTTAKYEGAVSVARAIPTDNGFFSSLKSPQIYYQIKRFGWRWDGEKWTKPNLYQVYVAYLYGRDMVDWIPHERMPDNEARALIIRGHQLYAVNRIYRDGNGKYRVYTHRNVMVLHDSETAFIQMPND